MNPRFRIAALLGFAAVALGAFGAHGLKQTLAALHTEDLWKTAASYHLAHAVVLLALAQSGTDRKWTYGVFMAGITIFSGSLYLLAVTGIRWLGAVTPFGGVCLLLGWLALALAKGRSGS